MSVKSFLKDAVWFFKEITAKQVAKENVRLFVTKELSEKGELTSSQLMQNFDMFACDPKTLKRNTNYISLARLYEILMLLEEENKIKCEKKFDLRSGKDRYFYSMK